MKPAFLLEKVVMTLRRDGIGPSARHAMVLFRRMWEPVQTDTFDARYGTDTGGDEALWKLDVTSANARFGVRYQPIHDGDLEHAVQHLQIAPSRFTFIDLGCGKGRSLLIAFELGFRRIVGVEFARELVEVAKTNMVKLGAATAAVIHGDAADYEFPPGNLLIMFNNPFAGEIMARVIQNLGRSVAQRPQDDIYIVYFNPQCADVLDAAQFLQRLGSPIDRDNTIIWSVRRDRPDPHKP